MSWVGDTPESRVRRLVAAARGVADPNHHVGRRARELLPAATGLSPEGVEYALTHCLETHPTDGDLRTLCTGTPSARRAHVLLSANVFVAAHRAIAIGLASSPVVEVRVSRREPTMAALLLEAEPGLFRIVDELAPLPAERVWAYGGDATLAAIRGDLPGGVVLHAHGDGMGVVVVQTASEERDALAQMRSLARALALDVVAFDQRGCLSPRTVLVLGHREAARELAAATAKQLAALEHEIPRGRMSAEELGEQVWYRDTMVYACGLLPAGKGSVGYDVERERIVVPPVGRNLHVVAVEDLGAVLTPIASAVTAAGVAGPTETWEAVRRLLPQARVSAIGKMQMPRLDGPVDRRPDLAGEVL
jgi:hypothetical protein